MSESTVVTRSYPDGTVVQVDTVAGTKTVTPPGESPVVVQGPGSADLVPTIQTPPPNLQPTEPQDLEPYVAYKPSIEEVAAQSGSPFIAAPVEDPLTAVAQGRQIAEAQAGPLPESEVTRLETMLESFAARQAEQLSELEARINARIEGSADAEPNPDAVEASVPPVEPGTDDADVPSATTETKKPKNSK